MQEEVEKIVAIIRENLIDIMPELEDQEFSNDETFVDLGTNSIDRADIIAMTLEAIDLEVSRIEFVKAKTINELAGIIAEKRQALI